MVEILCGCQGDPYDTLENSILTQLKEYCDLCINNGLSKKVKADFNSWFRINVLYD